MVPLGHAADGGGSIRIPAAFCGIYGFKPTIGTVPDEKGFRGMTDFVTADADVTASGASHIIVNTTGRLDAEASGASNVDYLGQPTLGNISASGGSNVNPQ